MPKAMVLYVTFIKVVSRASVLKVNGSVYRGETGGYAGVRLRRARLEFAPQEYDTIGTRSFTFVGLVADALARFYSPVETR